MLLRFKGMLIRSIINNILFMHMCTCMSIFAYSYAVLNTDSHLYDTSMHSVDKDIKMDTSYTNKTEYH